MVRSTLGRVLLAELANTQRWDVVGGVVETGESVVGRRPPRGAGGGRRRAARRRPARGRRVPGDGRERAEITCFLLDGGVHDESLIDAFTYPDGELVRAHWVEASEVRDRCGPRIGRLVSTAALDALRTGRLPGPPLMLVDGAPER